jgi:hypothetical protein
MMTGEYVFDDGPEPQKAALLATQIWSGLVFDEEARAALKRDGLMLDGLRLSGPMPFVFAQVGASRIRVTAPGRADSDGLLDLFRVWLLPRLRAAAGGSDAA